VNPSFRRVSPTQDGDELLRLLCGNAWPFHANPHPTPSDVAGMAIQTSDVDSFWIDVDGDLVGLVRLLDLADLEHGSPLFDIRIATSHRGQGLGTIAVRWLTSHLFNDHPELHRIEATTRVDNLAMQRVVERCGYRREGQLRDAWLSADGSRSDTLIYGITRPEWLPG
jgi:RimJ/RimL family protein N-acetyltransferase